MYYRELYCKFVYVDRTNADCYDTAQVCNDVIPAEKTSDDEADDEGCGCAINGGHTEPLVVGLLILGALVFWKLSCWKGRT